MKLKTNIDYKDFLFSVRKCRGEVYFKTESGDSLNLKSTLSEYVFISAAYSSDFKLDGFVECEFTEDISALTAYLEAD